MQTKDWLNSNSDKKKQLKAVLFPEEVLKYHEFFFPQKSENALIQQFYVAPIEKIEEEDKNKDKKKELAKNIKKDPKKDIKKPPPGKKGAKEEPEKKVVPLFDWIKQERDKIFIDKTNIISCVKDLLVSISLETV